jgi:hypothetical protein
VKITGIELGSFNVLSQVQWQISVVPIPIFALSTMSAFLNGLAYLSKNYGPAYAALIPILFACLVLSWRARGAAIRKIPGPPSPSWIFGEISTSHTFLDALNNPGNMLELMRPPVYGDYEFEWQKLYGPVYRVLMVSDPVSLQFIVNSPHFGVGPTLKIFLYLLFGDKSVVGATGITCPVVSCSKY